jgi:hypothetical protein
MRRISTLILLFLFALVTCGRPAFCAVVDDERPAVLSFEPSLVALPGDVFVVAVVLPVFIEEYNEPQTVSRCFEAYHLIHHERPPPFFA